MPINSALTIFLFDPIKDIINCPNKKELKKNTTHIHANPINSDFKENNMLIPIIKHANKEKTEKHAVTKGTEQ